MNDILKKITQVNTYRLQNQVIQRIRLRQNSGKETPNSLNKRMVTFNIIFYQDKIQFIK